MTVPESDEGSGGVRGIGRPPSAGRATSKRPGGLPRGRESLNRESMSCRRRAEVCLSPPADRVFPWRPRRPEGRGRELRLDANRSVHVLVAVAAEHVAVECERSDLVRDDAHARRLAGDDGGPSAKIRRIKAHDDIAGGELQDDRLVELDDELVGVVAELVGTDADHALGRLRANRDRASHSCERGRGDSAQDGPSIAQSHGSVDLVDLNCLQAATTGISVIAYFAGCASASTSRKPRPLYGTCGSHATGVRLGCDPGAGSANMRPLAA